MAQQTAVEWLEEQINTVKWKFADITDRNAIIQQAKQMEKEQIVKAYLEGDRNGFTRYKSIGEEQGTSEQYYQQTYGKGIL